MDSPTAVPVTAHDDAELLAQAEHPDAVAHALRAERQTAREARQEAAAARAEAQALRHALDRAQAAHAAGLPLVQAHRLNGTTPAELAADARELAELLRVTPPAPTEVNALARLFRTTPASDAR